MEQLMETHRSTPKDGWIIGENGQIYAAARPQDIERYIFLSSKKFFIQILFLYIVGGGKKKRNHIS